MWHFDGPTLFPHTNTWEQALDSTGARDITRLAGFLSTHSWQQLVPDIPGKFVSDGTGDGSARITAARTSDGSLAMFYISADGKGPRKIKLDLTDFPGPMQARWFNPAKEGPLKTAGPILKNREQQQLQTPGDNGTGANDWVLVMEALAK